MKSFLKLIDSFLNLFRPKRASLKLQETKFLDSGWVSLDSGGVPAQHLLDIGEVEDVPSTEENPNGGFGEMGSTAIPTILNSDQEFSTFIDPRSLSYHKGGLVPKKKRRRTKKAIAEANAGDILEILKWSDMLTATQLQKASSVRRDRFLPLLKKLVKQGKIKRTGSGKRGNPYFYRLTRKIK